MFLFILDRKGEGEGKREKNIDMRNIDWLPLAPRPHWGLSPYPGHVP